MAAVAALALMSPITIVAMVASCLAARFLLHSNFLAMRASLLLFPFIFGAITQSWWWAF